MHRTSVAIWHTVVIALHSSKPYLESQRHQLPARTVDESPPESAAKQRSSSSLLMPALCSEAIHSASTTASLSSLEKATSILRRKGSQHASHRVYWHVVPIDLARRERKRNLGESQPDRWRTCLGPLFVQWRVPHANILYGMDVGIPFCEGYWSRSQGLSEMALLMRCGMLAARRWKQLRH
jgi:hypothetical protein